MFTLGWTFCRNYGAAKEQANARAAVAVVKECIDDAIIDRILDELIKVNRPAIVASPHPEYDSGVEPTPGTGLPRNMLPLAFAELLAAELDCEVDEEIIQVSRPGRTN